jgi:hypothetical protein
LCYNAATHPTDGSRMQQDQRDATLMADRLAARGKA